ncbi:MAG: hypothetical protein IH820_04165 [Bacteroidetes bacterium]|nr:hypothetical protein [Bacteroidota bacterium]
MNRSRRLSFNRVAWMMVFAFIGAPLIAQAQQNLHFAFAPPRLELAVGDTVEVTVRLLNESDALHPEAFLIFARGRRGIEVMSREVQPNGAATTWVVAHRPGTYALTARTLGPRDVRVTGRLAVEILYPPLERIVFVDAPPHLYTGTTTAYPTRVIDAAGLEREGLVVSLTSSNPDVASTDPFGNVIAHAPGTTTLTAEVEDVRQTLDLEVRPNPVARLDLTSDVQEARTGDVVHFEAVARNVDGEVVADVPIAFLFQARPDDDLGPSASGQIDDAGRFVAETPGLYTIMASSGGRAAQQTVRIRPRNVRQQIEVIGHGPVLDVFTSDLWVWEGQDGRDYAVTGTWSANGEAYFWDVTDPANMTIIDTVTVDARTVNDVKVSEDGTVCVISREGASTRRNGIVILDCRDPSDVKILAEYDDELTGGVHNIFIYDNHVYAVNNGRRYDVINIEDPTNPHRVGRFELDTPGHRIHDVWIIDGIAYSSNWTDGVYLVDVGGVAKAKTGGQTDQTPVPEVGAGLAGGSPQNPVPFASYQYPSGWNHAAFPYRSASTGNFYVVAGDEAFPYPRLSPEEPEKAAGWLHFVDFTDIEQPKEVARYQVPEAGSHNYWIEDDILYAAFYNGGLRVVDLSGELMGDLYRQGREIAMFLPSHPEGRIRNAPMVWGPQPHKGTIFLADHYSGLWAVRLVPNEAAGTR